MQHTQSKIYFVVYEKTFLNDGIGIKCYTIHPQIESHLFNNAIEVAEELCQRFPESEHYRVEIVRHIKTFDTIEESLNTSLTQ